MLLAARAVGAQLAGRLLTVTLNRPSVLNALSISQCKALAAFMPQVASEGPTHASALLLEGAGDRAFCSGADVKAIAREKNVAEARSLFLGEYIMDSWIAAGIGIPSIALWKGVVMGGGVGFSVFTDYRLATTDVKFGMPETALGLFPDVGAAFFFRDRLGRNLAVYCGLLGVVLNAGDLAERGFASKITTLQEFDVLKERLTKAVNPNEVKVVIDAVTAAEPPIPVLSAEVEQKVEHFFVHENLAEIIPKLENAQDTDSWAKSTLADLRKKCPTSCAIWMEQVKRAETAARQCNYVWGTNAKSPEGLQTLRRVYELDYRLSQWICEKDPGKNFYEGTRALLVDKTKDPKWFPAAIEDVQDVATVACDTKETDELLVNELGLPMPSIML